MTSPFRAATAVTTLERSETDGSYAAVIDPIWTIGPKVHGGTMLATCAAAAKAQLSDGATRHGDIQPLAVSVTYLNAPDPGEVALTTIVRKRGKQISHVDVEMTQGGRVAVRAVVTLGRPDVDAPRHEVPSSLASMPVEPPSDAQPIGGDHPMASIVNVAKGCDMRIDPSSAHFLSGKQGELEVRMWVRPVPGDEADVDTAALFALMAGDISARDDEPWHVRLGSDGAVDGLLTRSARRGMAEGCGQQHAHRRYVVRGGSPRPGLHGLGRRAEPTVGDGAAVEPATVNRTRRAPLGLSA